MSIMEEGVITRHNLSTSRHWSEQNEFDASDSNAVIIVKPSLTKQRMFVFFSLANDVCILVHMFSMIGLTEKSF